MSEKVQYTLTTIAIGLGVFTVGGFVTGILYSTIIASSFESDQEASFHITFAMNWGHAFAPVGMVWGLISSLIAKQVTFKMMTFILSIEYIVTVIVLFPFAVLIGFGASLQ